MVVVVIVLAVVAVAALAALIVTRSRLATQRLAADEAARRADAAAEEFRRRQSDLAAAGVALDDANAQLETARADAAAATTRAEAAEESARAADERGGVDPEVLWTLERARSERTWRFSVAPGPDSMSELRQADSGETAAVLVEALRIELEAAREEVGTVVELDADVPAGVTTSGAVLALRAAQELLADVVRRSESTTLRVRARGADLDVAVESVDDEGAPVTPAPLPLPASPSIEAIDGGVRLRGAIATDGAGPAADGDLDHTVEILYPSVDEAEAEAEAEAEPEPPARAEPQPEQG